MFDFIKKGGATPPDVKQIRQQLLLFIKDQLKKTEGGEGASIKALQLSMAAGEDQHLYEAAVFLNEPNRFKNEEVQRIADDYDLDLPKDWALELMFPEELPADAVKSKNLPVALAIITKRHVAARLPKGANIRILTGKAEQENYQITPASGRIYIGRDKSGQTADGFLRENTIAFPSDSENESNKFVSRQHAHIEWDGESGCFCLYADEGGIPPRNKVKVQRGSGEQVRLQTMEIGHQLQPGDKIVLGGSVLLEFDYIKEEA
jgi:hypothetical protein